MRPADTSPEAWGQYEAQADRLAEALGSTWSVDAELIPDALRRRRAFNIFHNAQLETGRA